MKNPYLTFLAIVGLTGAILLCLAATPSSGQVTATPYVWRPVQMIAGGFITGITMHPTEKNLFYVRTDVGGAYRWEEKTQHWIPLLDFLGPEDEMLLGVEALAVDPSDARRLYVATGDYTASSGSGDHRKGAVFRSTDRGATFERTDLPIELGANEPGRFSGERMVVDPEHPETIYLGTPSDGLYVSRDQGKVWTQRKSFPVSGRTGDGAGVIGVVFDEQIRPHRAIFVAVMDPVIGLYRSDDDGASWRAVKGQPSGRLANHLALSGDSLYLTYGDKPGPRSMTDGAVWRYDIAQASWANVTPERAGAQNPHGYAGLCVDPRHPGTVLVSTMGTPFGDDIQRTEDAGAHWSSLSDRSVRDTSLAPYMRQAGETRTAGWYLGALAVDPFDSNHMLYGTGAMLYQTHDLVNVDHRKSIHWTIDALGIEEVVVTRLISPPVGAHLLSALMDVGGFRHVDLDHSPPAWKDPVVGTSNSIDFAEQVPNVIVRSGWSTWGARIGYSKNGGADWTGVASERKGTDGKPLGKGGFVAISSDARTLMWANGDGDQGVYRTEVNPASDKVNARWVRAKFQGGEPKHWTTVFSDRVDPATFYCHDKYDGTLWVSRDSGASFVPRDVKVHRADLALSPAAAGEIWMAEGNAGGGPGALRHSIDFGKSFERLKSVQAAWAIGFGKAGPGKTRPALYLSGQVRGVMGLFRSDDDGLDWTRINDAAHQYSLIRVITGDPRVEGRVYIGTPGRGILYGDPQ